MWRLQCVTPVQTTTGSLTDHTSHLVIHILVNQSGELGLEAFLPSTGRKFPKKMRGTGSLFGSSKDREQDAVPRLPLTGSWQSTDFRISTFLPLTEDMTVREWVLRALYRYRFVLGECLPPCMILEC